MASRVCLWEKLSLLSGQGREADQSTEDKEDQRGPLLATVLACHLRALPSQTQSKIKHCGRDRLWK